MTVSDIVGDPTENGDVTTILMVCTANQCRSVLASAIAGRRLSGGAFEIDSAGLLPGGRPVPRTGILVGRELGFDLSTHSSKRVDVHRLREWDIILTAAREQARELVAAEDALRPRVFTIRQFARWIGTHHPPRHVRIGAWLDLVAADRPRTELIGASQEDDIADPLESPPEAWREVARLISRNIDLIASGLGA